jgi:prevent-host-death family protein
MAIYSVHKAKTNLSKLIERAEAGEDVVIARRDKPAARLVAMDDGKTASKRKFGAFKGQVSAPASFFAPLPEDELDAWEGGSPPTRRKSTPKRSQTRPLSRSKT